jgi:high-affinity iron transporter
MLATLVIVFREAIEAGLIVGIVLAATQGVPKRGRWVVFGVAGGAAGAGLVAAFAGAIASMLAGAGQELFNATVLLLAVGMLIWHNVWMAGRGREIASEMRAVGKGVAAGTRSLAALSIVVGVAVMREGSEVALFLYGVAAAGGSSATGMLTGGLLGLAAGAAVSALMYFGLLAVPAGSLFKVITVLITLLAAGLASQAVAFIQQAGFLEQLSTPLWNTSSLLREDSIFGRLLHTLVGYTDQPDGMQLIAYLAVIGVVIGAGRLIKPAARTPNASSSADPAKA